MPELTPETGKKPRRGGGYRNRRTQVTVALIGACGTIVVALIAIQPWKSSNPCTASLTITSPAGGQSVSGPQGVEITGKSCDMGSSTGWLFDYDPNDKHYYMDFGDSVSPTVVNNGSWAFNDSVIGNPGDDGQQYGITIVLANPACAAALQGARPDASGDIRLTSFPAGCKIEQTVDVLVTYPGNG